MIAAIPSEGHSQRRAIPARSRALDPAIIARFRAGDRRAFAAVFDYYYEPLCCYAMRAFLGSPDDAEDVVQMAFVKVWRVVDTLPASVPIAACLYQVARTEALNLLGVRRRRRALLDRHTRLGVVRPPPQPDETTDQRLLFERIERAVASLPRRCREAFWLRRIAGLSYKEIAHTLGMEPRTAETHVRDGHRRLRDQITDPEP
jgi:RNA polymerase sigma factor (sigma-70 family)